MVIVEATGPVEQVEQMRDTPTRTDGSDKLYQSVKLVDRREMRLSVEFPDGYVNLEGYSNDRMGMGLRETSISHYVPDGWQIVDPDEWTLEINGNMREWVIQAKRYIEERPDMSIEDALRAFESWEETNCDAEYTIEKQL